MKKLVLAACALFFACCSSGNSDQHTTESSSPVATRQTYDNALPKGKVTDGITCRNDQHQSYALYLPSYYTPDKKFPCIYFFDAHARGALPVRSYKDLAEQYGFVLIGSNVSKNGMQWADVSNVAKMLMDDVSGRINIDVRRIYISGFSGGARVAGTLAITDTTIAGVIACAAGLPRVDLMNQRKFDFFGMVGNYDFNLGEMVQLDQTLQQSGFAHQLLTFDGKHDWPAAADFEIAMLWLQINAMKENRQPKSEQVISAFKSDYEKEISIAKGVGEVIKEHDLLDGMIRILDGLADVSSYKQQLDELTAGTSYKNALALQAQLQQTEAAQQQALQQEFAAHNDKWWAGKIKAMNQSAHSAKTNQEAQMNQRLVNYLGLVSYMNCSHALNTGDLNNAATYLKVFKLADPQNPDCSYLTAILYTKQGNPQAAITALNEAAKLGYSEASNLITEPSFAPLQNDAAFKDVLNKVLANGSK